MQQKYFSSRWRSTYSSKRMLSFKLQIGKKMFRDRLNVFENLTRDYILGLVLHRTKQFCTGSLNKWKTLHHPVNGEMLAQSFLQTISSPILKTKGKIKLLPSSISVIEIRKLEISGPNSIYELDFNIFQLPEGIIPLGA